MSLRRCLIAGLAPFLLASPAWAAGLPDVALTRLDGGKTRLSRYAGKVLLVVNTASRCGFTGQYEGLQQLHQKYQKRGLAVLGFPSNDFMGQEPGNNKEIQAFCQRDYGVTFDMFDKGPVTGQAIQPVFGWLTGPAAGAEAGPVRWNFEKFVVDRKGRITARFRSVTGPDSQALVAAVEGALSSR